MYVYCGRNEDSLTRVLALGAVPRLRCSPLTCSPDPLFLLVLWHSRLLPLVRQDAYLLCANREYTTFVGRYKDKEIAVVSHGIGGGGASMCFEELAQVRLPPL